METAHRASEATPTSILNSETTDNNCILNKSLNVTNQQNNNLNHNAEINQSSTKQKAEHLNVLVVNFQSIRNKKDELSLLLAEKYIDIVLGS